MPKRHRQPLPISYDDDVSEETELSNSTSMRETNSAEKQRRRQQQQQPQQEELQQQQKRVRASRKEDKKKKRYSVDKGGGSKSSQAPLFSHHHHTSISDNDDNEDEDEEAENAHGDSQEEGEADGQDDVVSWDSSEVYSDGNQQDTDSSLLEDEEQERVRDVLAMKRKVRGSGHLSPSKRTTGRADSTSDSSATSSAPSEGSSSAPSSESEDEEVNELLNHFSGEVVPGEAEEGEGEEDEEDEEDDGEEDEDDDDDDDDEEGRENITVDFGVYDMEPRYVNAMTHLMDQFCPDHMNEIDRDDLGAALLESPYTCVVKVDDGGAEDKDGTKPSEEEEEEEVYGFASVLDLPHNLQRHPASLRALYDLLCHNVWRAAASGLPPQELLLATASEYGGAAEQRREEEEEAEKKKKKKAGGDAVVPRDPAKCLLLLSEYIRNVPMELTVQILEDILQRLEDAQTGMVAEVAEAETEERVKRGEERLPPVYSIPSSMFAVLAKVQQAADAKSPKDSENKTHPAKKKQRGAESTAASSAKSAANSNNNNNNNNNTSSSHDLFDLSHHIFWREEDEVLYAFRDKRVAALLYRCRAQYEGQPESEWPLSVLFVVQSGALRQALDELKRRTAQSDMQVVRF